MDPQPYQPLDPLLLLYFGGLILFMAGYHLWMWLRERDEGDR